MATGNPRKGNGRSGNGSAPAGSNTEGIEVVAKRETFFRAGLQFGHEPKQVALDTLTRAQLDDIMDEPMLIVREIKIDPDAAQTEGAGLQT
jgi:hypothetical protein